MSYLTLTNETLLSLVDSLSFSTAWRSLVGTSVVNSVGTSCLVTEQAFASVDHIGSSCSSSMGSLAFGSCC